MAMVLEARAPGGRGWLERIGVDEKLAQNIAIHRRRWSRGRARQRGDLGPGLIEKESGPRMGLGRGRGG